MNLFMIRSIYQRNDDIKVCIRKRTFCCVVAHFPFNSSTASCIFLLYRGSVMKISLSSLDFIRASYQNRPTKCLILVSQ